MYNFRNIQKTALELYKGTAKVLWEYINGWMK